jgi:hypothetical protein
MLCWYVGRRWSVSVAPNVVVFAWFENSHRLEDKGRCSCGEKTLALRPTLTRCKIDDRAAMKPQHCVASDQSGRRHTVSAVAVLSSLVSVSDMDNSGLLDFSLEPNS